MLLKFSRSSSVRNNVRFVLQFRTEYRTIFSTPGNEEHPMNTAPVSEVRDKLSDIVEDVATTGTEWVITRHGKPVAVMLGIDEYESLIESLNILSDDDTMAAIDEALADIDEGRVSSEGSEEA
jgi:prevent-host-death family protein